jgi:hypothetical protein
LQNGPAIKYYVGCREQQVSVRQGPYMEGINIGYFMEVRKNDAENKDYDGVRTSIPLRVGVGG